jgi:hypothetical protein
MNGFLARHADSVTGILSGFDRLVLRGTLRALSAVEVMMQYLSSNKVLLKDFGEHVQSVSDRVKRAAYAAAAAAACPVLYLESSAIRKEDVARQLAAERHVEAGPIALLTCVEGCRSYAIHRNAETKHLELQFPIRRCLHLYRYQIHPVFGFMHVRLQTWFPFTIHVCLNGREWLSRQMDRERIGYVRKENCFTHMDDVARAQALFDQQTQAAWPALLDELRREIHPLHDEIFRDFSLNYYWTGYQSEYATDVMFRSPRDLAALMPLFVRHAMTTFGSRDVMRFLGRRVPAGGGVNRRFKGEVVTDLKERPEGVCVRHRMNGNSIKMYDKHGNLRVETTVNEPEEFLSFRTREGDPGGEKAWRRMRRGIADLHRRAEVSCQANERYLEALATVKADDSLKTVAEPLCRPVKCKGRRARAMNPLAAEDARLLESVNRGEFTINGFRNRDLRALLYPEDPSTPQEGKKRSAAVTRKIRLLRAHGLIHKAPRTHRYKVSPRGRSAIVALVVARQASIKALAEAAA